jgi:hypothetical protein
MFGFMEHERHVPRCPKRPSVDRTICVECGSKKELKRRCKVCRHEAYMLARGNQVKAEREARIVNFSGLCECGCGQITPVRAGKHQRFIFRHAASLRRARRLLNESAGMKMCRGCGEPKTLDDFCLSKSGGRQSRCKLCLNAGSKKRFERNRPAKLETNREWYEANREARGKQTATWRRANPEKVIGYGKRWRERNPEKVRAFQSEYYRTHRQQFKDWRIRREKEHPERTRASYNKYRANAAANGGSYTDADWHALLVACKYRCVCCGVHPQQMKELYPGRRRALEHDHIIPIVLGGTSWIWNMQPLCPACNNFKRYKAIDYRPKEVRFQFRDES